MLDIGNVFSNTFSMMKERWLPLLGLCAVFFGLLIVYGIIVGAVIGGSAMAMAGSMSDPSAAGLAGMGIGFIILAIIFYIGYFAIIFGQQGSMIAYASPLRRTNFGDALTAGLKGGLSFLGVILLFIVAYILFAIVAAILTFILGEAGAVILLILVLPVMIYLACRFAVLVPVIVVERVFNPITAIMRCWEVTRGNALGIFIVLIITTIIAMVLLGVPFFLFFGAMFASVGSTGDLNPGAAIGSAMFGILFFVVMYFVYMIFITSLTASLHAEISDSEAVDLGKTFE